MKIPEKYINEIINKYKDKQITPEMIKKDLALSYILCEISNHKEKNEDSPFHKIIFKGGTLLAKSHLNYHRISEDLDFTFKYNLELNTSSNNEREILIKKFLKKEFLPVLTEICKKFDFDFDANEINKTNERKYCPLKYSPYWNKFNVYINVEEINPIKIEINFCDELFYNLKQSKIIHLHPSSEHLIYPLENIQIESYAIEEILIEKLRAIITRKEGVHERDLYDLFLLFNKGHDLFKITHKDIKNKIIQGIGYQLDKNKEQKHIIDIQKRLDELEKSLEGEIKTMNLTNYDSKKYQDFFNKLKNFILSINFKNL